MRKVSPQYLRILLLCLVMALLTALMHRRGMLDRLELRSLDWRFVERGARRVRDDIVIVAVDDKSIQDLEAGFVYDAEKGEQRWKWPWPLDVHARLIEVLSKAGASAIAFDILFSEGDPRFSQGQEEMARAIKKSGRVFLAAFYSPDEVRADQTHGEGLASYGARIVPLERLDAFDYVRAKLSVHRGKAPSWLGKPTTPEFWTLPLNSLLREARGFGNIDIPTMVDGVYRFVEPALWAQVTLPSGEAGYQIYPHLSLAIAAHHLRVPPDQLLVEQQARIRLGNEGVIPVRPAEGKDTQATLLIDYAPTSVEHSPFKIYSYSSVLRMGAPVRGPEDLHRLSPTEFKDKIVLIGATAKALSDIRMNPHSASTAGVETQAHILDTLLQRRFLRETSDAFFVGVILTLGLTLGGALSLTSMRLATTLTVFLAAVYLAGSLLAFDHLLLVTPMVMPIVQIAASWGAVMAYRYATEERDKRQVRRFFELYVSENVAEMLLNDPKAQELGGARGEITALFVDIRGFTSMSERLPPEAVVRVLNEYFDAMVEVLDGYRGTLDKFIGDGMMVLFNAPLPQPDHARLAVETGLAMLERLQELRGGWEERGLPRLDIGVGICTGVAVVGNVGSRRRHQYTAIGDPVNTASRLESLNKDLGTHLLISESTHYQVTGLFEARRLPPAQLHGKQDPVGVYEVLAMRGLPGAGVQAFGHSGDQEATLPALPPGEDGAGTVAEEPSKNETESAAPEQLEA
jgi:adenylate cyclase